MTRRNQALSVAAVLTLGLGTLTMIPQTSYAADAGESHGSNGGGYDGHAHNGNESGPGGGFNAEEHDKKVIDIIRGGKKGGKKGDRTTPGNPGAQGSGSQGSGYGGPNDGGNHK